MQLPLFRSRRGPLALATLLFVASTPAWAIQLHWAGGATDFTALENTRAILVVQADSAEVTLPNSWQLEWTADSTLVQFAAFDPNQACLVDTAKVDSIIPPQAAADSAANEVTALFCSSGSNNAATAYFLAEIVAGSHGKMRVIAIDPTDTTQVMESNEVTFNGGVGGDYSPTILRATSTHETSQLQVTVLGTNLSTNTPLSVMASDGLWSVPLAITSQTTAAVRGHARLSRAGRMRRTASTTATAVTLTATAEVPTALPSAIVKAGEGVGSVAIAPLAADQLMPLDVTSLPDTVLVRDSLWAAGWYPKDFSFYYNVVPSGNAQYPWKSMFHLMYIRARPGDAGSELGHAWSSNLIDWHFNLHAFEPRHNGGWEDKAVWAPTVLQVGDSTVMFYTGLDPSGNQRIGYAKTNAFTDTTTNAAWVRQPNSVWSAGNTGWADPSGSGYASVQQFRDPFVMPDPDNAGRYLMFMVGEDKNWGAYGTTVVGAARNAAGTFNSWSDLGSYRSTDSSHAGIAMHAEKGTAIVESPLAMRDSAGTGAWRIFFANANYDTLTGDNATFFITEATGYSVSDTTARDSVTAATHWPGLDNLYTYLNSDGSLIGWQACEHLQVGTVHLFAGFNGDGIAITRTYWDPSTGSFKIGRPPFITGVPKSTPGGGARFYLAGYRPGQATVRFALETPNRVTPRVVLYDLAGRRVRTLSDGKPSQGRREWGWDCKDQGGQAVASGMYFARLTGVGAPRLLRVVVVK